MRGALAIKRGVLVVGVALSFAPRCWADFTTTFESPDYSGTAAGTILTGQQGWTLPAGSTDYNVCTYAGNALGVAQNPNGGNQFIGGQSLAGNINGRAQLLGLDYSGSQPYLIGYDFNGNYIGVAGSANNNLGSFSLQPSGTTQSYIALKAWNNPADPTLGYQAQYNVYDASGAALSYLMPYTAPFKTLTTNHWYREDAAVDFTSHRILRLLLTDLATADQQTFFPSGWYLQGGAASTLPLPTGMRFFTGGASGDNVMAWDNLSIAQVPTSTAVTWNGGAANDDNWTAAPNWGGTAPVAGQQLQFGVLTPSGHVSNQNDFDPGTRFNGITFLSGAPAYNLTGHSILLGGAVTNQSDSDQAISTDLQLLFFVAGSFDTGGKSLTVSGAVSGTGPLVKSGTGTLILGNTNSYTCGTNINSGTLQIRSDVNLGAASGALTFNGGALKLAAAGIASARGVTLNSGGGTVDTGGFDATLSGPIAGAGGLTKTGAGKLVLAGPNGYTGGTTINAGILEGTHASIRGPVANNGSVVFNQTADGSFAAQDSGSGALTKTGSATLSLLGVSNNTYRGDTLVSQGTLKVVAMGVLPVTQNLLYQLDASDSGNVVKDGSNQVSLWRDRSGSGRDFAQSTTDAQPLYVPGAAPTGLPMLRFDGSDDRLTMGTATLPQTVFIVNSSLAAGGLQGIWGADGQDKGIRMTSSPAWSDPGDGNDFTNGGGAMYINGVLGSSFGTLGTYHLLEATRGSNTDTYSTTGLGWYFGGRVFQGDIAEVLAYDSVLSTTDRQAVETYLQAKWLTGGGGGVGDANAIGDLSHVQLTYNTSNPSTLDLTDVNETIGSLGGDAGTFVALGKGLLTTGGDNRSTTFAGTITSATSGTTDSLVKVGAGTMTLTGTNTYSGSTTIKAGVLDATLGAAAGLPDASGLYLSGGVLQSSGTFSRSLASEAGSGTVTWYTAGGQTGGGGFAARGSANLTVNLSVGGTAGGTVTWGSTAGFIGTTGDTAAKSNDALVFGSVSADHTVVWQNPIRLTTTAAATREIRVNRSLVSGAPPEVRIAAGISDTPGQPGTLKKTGDGTLILSASNSYTGGTTVNAGTLQVALADALPTGGNLTIASGGHVVLNSGLSHAVSLGGLAITSGAGASFGAGLPTPPASGAWSGDRVPTAFAASPAAAPTPEPGAIALLAAGALAGLAAWRRRRHAN